MKILGGIHPDYEGETRIGGVPVRLDSPRRSMQLGIAVIHQEFSLVPSMTIAENILLGHEPALGPMLRKQAIRKTAADRLREVGLKLPLDRAVGAVGVATQQLTEIAKALSRKAQVLVMDEPTARLSEHERLKLFDIVRGLAARGVGIVYISHFLEEIFEIANRVNRAARRQSRRGPRRRRPRRQSGDLTHGGRAGRRGHEAPSPANPSGR